MLILVRHGQTAHNASLRLLGRLDVPIDEMGERQAAALGTIPDLRDARRVISSPLARARQTAERLGPPVNIDDRWVEMDYGIYDGLSLGDVPSEIWDRWLSDPAWCPEGGESHLDLDRRVRSACEELWDDASGTDVVVVSHVSPIKVAVAWALGVGVEASWRMHLDTASICRIGRGRTGPSLVSFNQTDHRPSL
ncbi:MAG: histidine phosphatase family protein [Actinomycetota bacterium]|nr:histidine phosphatase family protein [Actinomycetota bacterium]